MVPAVGQRIELIAMPDDPHPIRARSRGTVRSVERICLGGATWYQVDVDWDDGRRLYLAIPPDIVRGI